MKRKKNEVEEKKITRGQQPPSQLTELIFYCRFVGEQRVPRNEMDFSRAIRARFRDNNIFLLSVCLYLSIYARFFFTSFLFSPLSLSLSLSLSFVFFIKFENSLVRILPE